MTLLKKIICDETLARQQIIPSYISAFDNKYLGFKRQSLTFVAGRPACGKTWLLCNWAVHIAKHSIPVVFFTAHLYDVAQRMAKIDAEFPDIHLEEMLVFNTDDFESRCRVLKPKIVFMDVYLLGNVVNQKILRRIKRVAKLYDFAVAMSGTLNRCIDNRSCKMPKITDFLGIKEQTGVLQNADYIFTLYNPSLYFPDFILPEERRLILRPVKMFRESYVQLFFRKDGKILAPKPELVPILN